ncbi:MAG TPA: hypothetical protein VE467_15695 [Chryseolinea sp.]|jgi:hypothetical protein|nr:hypothetical protein [Chryseolinea sp.]
MKMVFTLACGIAMICNLAAAQDTTLAKIEKTERASKQKVATETEMQKLVVEEAPAEKSETKFTLPDYSGKQSVLNNKVGPHGEALFMKNNKYYYLDDAGKKIKVKRNDLTEKPKSS